MPGGADLAEILERFEAFARVVEALPLYHRLTTGCAGDPEIAALLTSARPGQERPVLLFAAVHDLVLRQRDLSLARWYPSATDDPLPVTDDPWPVFRETCLEHETELRRIIATSGTQTNEVNRVALLAPVIARACADFPDTPVSLVELGASAGLLLGFERYRIDVGGELIGNLDSPVQVATRLRSTPAPDLGSFPDAFAERLGLDRQPVDLKDSERVRWLEACIWPDQPERMKRFRAAVDLLKSDPPRLIAGDFISELEHLRGHLLADTHVVVFDAWSLTYVAKERRPLVAIALEELAANGRPVSWVSAEPPGCTPGIEPPADLVIHEEASADTVMGLRRWRDGREGPAETVGWGHHHGDWCHLVEL